MTRLEIKIELSDQKQVDAPFAQLSVDVNPSPPADEAALTWLGERMLPLDRPGAYVRPAATGEELFDLLVSVCEYARARDWIVTVGVCILQEQSGFSHHFYIRGITPDQLDRASVALR